MKRLHQIILTASFPPLCWLLMMAFHELGHVVAGWATGGTITKVVLHPFAISRTDVSPNPSPLVVAWAGPIVGSLLPPVAYGISRVMELPVHFLPRFFSGFCLIANGAYIGIGSLGGIGDAGDMLLGGSPIWSLWLFGLIAVPSGLALWHRLGPDFGLGESRGNVNPFAAYLSLLLLALTLAVEFALSPAS